MTCFKDLIDNKNKLKYRRLVDYIDEAPMSDFLKDVGSPFLMGKDLYEGHLSSEGEGRDTFRFLHAADFSEEGSDTSTQPLKRMNAAPNTSAISHAVYILNKGEHSEIDDYNIFSLGRTTDNDLAIVDYAISKRHAQIRHLHGVFYIQDLDSTNGVFVNSERIEPFVEVPISFGSTINLGRFGLVFARPLDLYNAIKKEVMIEKARGLRASGTNNI